MFRAAEKRLKLNPRALYRPLTGSYLISPLSAASLTQSDSTSIQRVNFSTKTNGEKYLKPISTKQFGIDILHDPLWNKSMAFEYSERDRLGLRGLLPPEFRTLENQVQRTINHIRQLPTPVTQNLYLQDMHDRNETLFHRVLVDYIEELAPLVYTPTVGVACQQFGSRFRRARGMYFSVHDVGQFNTMVYNWPHNDVAVIVVTDGSRILGLGDLGAQGMGIPIGKLALYCAAGGIAPHRVLPITLDVGTNNEMLLKDPNYIGVRRHRLEGKAYFDVIDEFVHAVFARWPDVVLQFEDFETAKAVPILEKYRHTHRVFNDDIQGTGSVTLAGIISAGKIAGKKLSELTFACAGAGSAGLGVCDQIVKGMMAEGLTEREARSRFVVLTVEGALGGKPNPTKTTNHKDDRTKGWVNMEITDGASLLEVVQNFKPQVLLGLTACPGVFTEEILRTMAQNTERPIIMPMSNPTSRCECTAEEAYRYTDGKAIVATGSPFEKVTLSDGRTFVPSQCNNMYVFPGLGLGAYLAGVDVITDKMLFVSAVACANSVSAEEVSKGQTFPHISRIREVSHSVACAVIRSAVEDGIASKITPRVMKEGIENYVSRKMYFPKYVPLVEKM